MVKLRGYSLSFSTIRLKNVQTANANAAATVTQSGLVTNHQLQLMIPVSLRASSIQNKIHPGPMLTLLFLVRIFNSMFL